MSSFHEMLCDEDQRQGCVYEPDSSTATEVKEAFFFM